MMLKCQLGKLLHITALNSGEDGGAVRAGGAVSGGWPASQCAARRGPVLLHAVVLRGVSGARRDDDQDVRERITCIKYAFMETKAQHTEMLVVCINSIMCHAIARQRCV